MKLTLDEQFGQIDIYVFDQILRGNIAPGMRVLDAGCGYGRNLVYLLREGCEVFALDANAEGVAHVRQLSAVLETGLPAANFQVGVIEQMPFADGFADVVLCNSVLHFARDRQHFRAMLADLWRVLRPGGMLFCRIGSRIGMDFEQVHDGIFVIGDGSEWFLVDEQMLLTLTEELGGVMVDPLKTTVVQDYRCMTTWCCAKDLPFGRMRFALMLPSVALRLTDSRWEDLRAGRGERLMMLYPPWLREDRAPGTRQYFSATARELFFATS